MLKTHLSLGLARLAALARQEDWRVGEIEGLTPTQGDILRMLVRRPEGLRLTTLAAHLLVSQPTASDAVTTLERKGLTRKFADPGDGRAILVRATRAGRSLANRWPLSFDAIVDALAPQDQTAMLGIVTRAISTLQRQGVISPQRLCLSCSFFAPNIHRDKTRPHHCRLVDAPLGEGDLRTDCPEHQGIATAPLISTKP